MAYMTHFLRVVMIVNFVVVDSNIGGPFIFPFAFVLDFLCKVMFCLKGLKFFLS